MRTVLLLIWFMGLLFGVTPARADVVALEGLLRVQVLDYEFVGFDRYQVTIESDQQQPDGFREVTAVASAQSPDCRQRLKVLLLVIGDQVVGGQILEKISTYYHTNSDGEGILVAHHPLSTTG
jgi:hypothetical protein